jgi:WD40 repeat protein
VGTRGKFLKNIPCTFSKQLILWILTDLNAFRDVNDVTWRPDGKSLASASDDNTVRIWDVSSGQCQSILRGDKPINGVAFSPDAKILAVGDGFPIGMGTFVAGDVRFYDPVTGEVKLSLGGHSAW